MSNQNESHSGNTETQLHEDLKHYSWVKYLDHELEEMTLEELRKDFREIEHLNYKISGAYEEKKRLHDRQLKVNQELRVAFSEWHYAARTLFSAAVDATSWISAVKTNLKHIEGFTHHMKSVVNQLNINELESAENELMTPIERIRDLFKKDGGMSDIPF